MDKLAPATASDESSPTARVARDVASGCDNPDALVPESRARCAERSRCATLFGIVDKPGPTTIQFLRNSKTPGHFAAVAAKITLNLPSPDSSPSQASLPEVMSALSASEYGRGPSSFREYWYDRRPLAFPNTNGLYSGAGKSSAHDNALFGPWLSSNHVIETVGIRVLGGRLDPEQAASVPAELILPWVADHHFEHVPPGQIKIPEIARFVPREAAWVRFTNARKLTETLDRIEDLASGAMLGLQQEAKDRKLRARYAAEVGIEEKTLVRLFEDGFADDLGLVTHDLSLRDGTDLTLVIHLVPGKDGKERLRQSIALVGERANAKVSTEVIRERQVTRFHSADSIMNSHLLFEGDWAIVSNSSVAFARVLDSSLGSHKSVTAELDYRYLRGLGNQQAEGTMHLGAAFWDAQLSATLRVEHRRRLICAGEMQVLSSAVLAYRRDRGESPSMKQLVAARYLLGDDLRCPDGGAIDLENGSPHCTVHGTLAALSPVLDHLPKTIKPVERDGYRAYFATPLTEDEGDSREQDQFGKQFMMPMEVEFSVGKEFVAKARALPDRDSEFFTKLRTWLGRNSVELTSKASPPGTIASTAAVFDSADLRNLADWLDLGTADKDDFGTHGRFAFDRWLTGQAQLYIGDGAPPISVPTQGSAATSAMQEMAQIQLGVSAAITAMIAPVSGILSLKDADLAREALDQLLSKLSTFSWLTGTLEGYELLPYRDTTVRVLSINLVNFHFYFAFVDKSLLFSNRKPTMLALIDRYADKSVHSASTRGQVSIELFPKQFNASLDGLESAWQEQLRRVCHEHLATYELLAQAHGPRQANDPALTRTYFGFDAKCPEGGRYLFDLLEGGAYCSVHGRYGHSRQPTHLSQRADSSRLFRPMKYIRLSLATTEHTLESELHIERE